jgi:hypothetical protein
MPPASRNSISMTGAALQRLEMSLRAQVNWRWPVAIEELKKLAKVHSKNYQTAELNRSSVDQVN